MPSAGALCLNDPTVVGWGEDGVGGVGVRGRHSVGVLQVPVILSGHPFNKGGRGAGGELEKKTVRKSVADHPTTSKCSG